MQGNSEIYNYGLTKEEIEHEGHNHVYNKVHFVNCIHMGPLVVKMVQFVSSFHIK